MKLGLESSILLTFWDIACLLSERVYFHILWWISGDLKVGT